MPTGTLSGKGKALFEKIYNASKEAGDSPEIAARKAWAGIKNAGWHKNKDGEWVKGKSDVFQEFSMAVSKISFDKNTQERHITLVASDTDPDLSGERMSPHLFQDFVNRIENDIPVPEAFRSAICEDGWCGGMPYLSISHYRSAAGKNVPGEIKVSYVDGNRFKSKAMLYDTVLGKAVFKSLNDDLTGKSEFDDKVRVSIGFLDLAHKHGDFLFERKGLTDSCPKCAEGEGDKEYWEGVLVHEAFTRKPMNPRTDVEVQKMAIMTKKDDAESIVGKEVLEELDLEAKSQVADDDLVVIRSDGGMDMESHAARVRGAFHSQFAPPPEPSDPSPYVHSVHMDHVVASMGDGKLFKIGYSMDDDDMPKFDKKSAWQEVRFGLVPVKSDVEDAVIWEAATKSEGDCNHPSGHYLVVEDASKPTTWHLRYRDCQGKIDTRLLGAAKAALTVGYRGNKYEGPNKSEALAKLKKLYKSAGLEWKSDVEEPPMTEEIIDEVVKEPVAEVAAPEPTAPVVEPAPVVEESAVDKAVAVLKGKLAELKTQGVVGESALTAIQPAFNEVGLAVKNELTPKLDPATANILEIVRSAVAGEIAKVVAPLEARVAELSTKSGIATEQKRDGGVVARSLTIRPVLPDAQAASQPLSKIAQIAYKSTEPR